MVGLVSDLSDSMVKAKRSEERSLRERGAEANWARIEGS